MHISPPKPLSPDSLITRAARRCASRFAAPQRLRLCKLAWLSQCKICIGCSWLHRALHPRQESTARRRARPASLLQHGSVAHSSGIVVPYSFMEKETVIWSMGDRTAGLPNSRRLDCQSPTTKQSGVPCTKWSISISFLSLLKQGPEPFPGTTCWVLVVHQGSGRKNRSCLVCRHASSSC
jgi:hypothetical protein